MEKNFYQKVISAVPLLKTLDEGELAEIVTISHLVKMEKGAKIMVEGERGTSVFILLSGEVGIFKLDSEGVSQRIATVGSSEALGELALIDKSARSASAVTLRDSVLFRIYLAGFGRLRKEHSSASYTVLRQVAVNTCRRYRDMIARLSKVLVHVEQRSQLK